MNDIIFRVTERVSGLSIEGENLTMILKNTEEVDVEIVALNRMGGPADSNLAGTFSIQPPDGGGFTWHPSPGGGNKKGICRGNPQSPAVSGVLAFVGMDGAQQVNRELAVSIVPAGATTYQIRTGTAREQA